MAKKKKTTKAKKTIRTIACKHLKNIDEISNSRKPLCYCTARKFNLSPYNVICQVCKLYVENSSQLELKDMFFATEAKDFQFDENDLDYSDDDFVIEVEDDDEDEIKVKKKKSKKKSKKKVEEDDDDFEIEKVTEEEETEIVIGHEKEEKEDIDYEDESEEGLGKKHGPLKSTDEEDEEDDEFEDEIEDFDEKDGKSDDADDDESSIDFEADVINKIKKVGSGESIKEICPFCQKSKVSVLRHLSKCKRCPPEVISAYKIYRKKK